MGLTDREIRSARVPTEPAEQLAVVEEEDAEHLRDRERPQAVPDLLDHLLGQKGGLPGRPARGRRCGGRMRS